VKIRPLRLFLGDFLHYYNSFIPVSKKQHRMKSLPFSGKFVCQNASVVGGISQTPALAVRKSVLQKRKIAFLAARQ